MTQQQTIARARNCIRSGDLEQAKELLMSLVHKDAEAWFLLGAIHGQYGDFRNAILSSRNAVKINPDYADAYFNLAQAYGRTGDRDNALACYREVIRLQPRNAGALRNCAFLLEQSGNRKEAEPVYRSLIDVYLATLRHDPGNHKVMSELGWLYQYFNRNEEALSCYRKAVELDPQNIRAMLQIGSILASMRMVDAASEWLDRVISAASATAELCYQAGVIWKKQHNLEKSLVALHKAVGLDAGHVRAQKLIGNLYLSQGLQQHARRHYLDLLKRHPEWPEIHVGLIQTMNYLSADRDMIYRCHREWARLLQQGLVPARAHSNMAVPTRRLRVGYVSADFRAHSIANFIEPLLRNHSQDDFDIYCYSDVRKEDAVTGQLRKLAHHWRAIAHLDDEQADKLIRTDEIDILVDLAGHTGDNRLGVFARKPAPVQITYLGYPNTTGLDAVDYRITDERTDPEGTCEDYYSEQLIRLPGIFLCYNPLPGAPAVSGLPALSNGHITFGSFNNLAKITPAVLKLWTRILHEIPTSHLVLKNESLNDAAVRRRLAAVFADSGISKSRIQLTGWKETYHEHLLGYRGVDISLDTFPYNGTTTTCESLWMGVPVITLAGGMHAGRVGLSILSQAGLEDFIAATHDEYLGIAKVHAGSAGRLSEIRSRLRGRMMYSELCNGGRFTRKLESKYRDIWMVWCQRQTQH